MQNVEKQWSVAYKLSSIRGLLQFDIKKQHLQKVLDTISTSTYSNCEIEVNRVIAYKQLEKGYEAGDPMNSLFGQIFKQLNESSDDLLWFRKHAALYKVTFRGEGGADHGGLYNESVSQMCKEIMSNSLPLFLPSPNSLHDVGSFREKYVPRCSSNLPMHKALYAFIGKWMGVALRSDYPLALEFVSSVWKFLVGQKATLEDLKNFDVMCFNILNAVRHIENNQNKENFEKELLSENFTVFTCDGREVELKPNGKHLPVTWENKGEWAQLVEEFKLTEFNVQLEAIKQGLSSVIPIKLLSLFTWSELETMVTGSPTLDIEKLKKNTSYSHYSPTHEVVVNFWKMLESFTAEEQSLFLRFTWGRSRLPNGDIKTFSIHTLGSNDHLLPKSHTCGFSLDIPHYSSYEVMRKKFLYAIRECQAIDGDFLPNVNENLTWE